MEEQKSKYSDFLRPQEEMLEVGKQKSKLTIGVPKETALQENRIVLIPDGVGLLIKHGHQVVIESGAGTAAHFSDHEYSEAGGRIVYSPEEVFKADILLKVAPANILIKLQFLFALCLPTLAFCLEYTKQSRLFFF